MAKKKQQKEEKRTKTKLIPRKEYQRNGYRE